MEKRNPRLASYFILSEFFGTLMLATAVSGSCSIDPSTNKQKCDVLHLLIVLFISMLLFNRTGDADFNPGVTYLRFLTYKGEKKRLLANFMIPYFVAQTLGSICGFFLIYYLKNGFVAKLSVNQQCSQASGFLVEIVSSCVLYLIVVFQDDIRNDVGERDIMKYFVSISGVATGIALGGNVSGAGMNPAIGIGANMVRFMVTGNLAELRYLWIYILGPVIASHLISWFYLNFYKNEKFYIKKS